MERLIQCLFLLSVTLILTSCEKEELPAPKYDGGDAIIQQIPMTANYKYQVWYRLSDNTIVSTTAKTDWDIAFATDPSGIHLLLNSSKIMKAYKTNAVSLAQISDTSGLGNGGKADVPSGNLDSTAIGDWQAANTVYIINRGYNENGVQQGFYKLKINTVSSSSYEIEYGNIYGTQVHSAVVSKDPAYNFSYFSFGANKQLSIEPPKTDYDLCFTQYTTIFYDPFMYYSVTGTISNSYNTRVAAVFDKEFSAISMDDTLGRTFYSRRNVIGYDWKSYDLDAGLYTVDITMCYIIRDSKGFYYKLHFIDFYNEQGIKGYPKFEYRVLS